MWYKETHPSRPMDNLSPTIMSLFLNTIQWVIDGFNSKDELASLLSVSQRSEFHDDWVNIDHRDTRRLTIINVISQLLCLELMDFLNIPSPTHIIGWWLFPHIRSMCFTSTISLYVSSGATIQTPAIVAIHPSTVASFVLPQVENEIPQVL